MPAHSTHIRFHVKAPRSRVYRTMLDPDVLAKWKVPEGMSLEVHQFEARAGGTLRISLTYDARESVGKTTAHTDTYRGRFIELVPNEKIVEEDVFETSNPAMQGPMLITITLIDAEGGTDIIAVHEGVPEGVSAADNELGWRMALTKLAALVEEE